MPNAKALSRRTFIEGCAVVSGVATMAALTGCAEAKASAEPVGAVQEQYGFLVNMEKCVGCKKCASACRSYNKLSGETPDRRRVDVFANSRGENVYVSTSCMHCDDPNCLRVCPAGAISKNEAGIVTVDKGKCIGCKYCFQACPYGVPHYDDEAMDKCDGCVGAGVAPGDEPYCARACIFGGLTYGPVSELTAAEGGRAVPVGEPCGPNCYLVRGVK